MTSLARLAPVLVCAALLPLAGCVKLAQAPAPRVLSISAQAIQPVKNSISVIEVGVARKGATPEEVRAVLAKGAVSLTAFLKESKVDRLTTTEVSVMPHFDYINGKEVPAGYDGSISVICEVAVDQAGKILDGAITHGGNRIINVVSRPSEATIDEARRDAAQKATKKALDQAAEILKSSGLRQVGVARINVDTGYFNPGPQRMAMKAMSASAESDSLPVEGGESNLTATVSVEVEFE